MKKKKKTTRKIPGRVSALENVPMFNDKQVMELRAMCAGNGASTLIEIIQEYRSDAAEANLNPKTSIKHLYRNQGVASICDVLLFILNEAS